MTISIIIPTFNEAAEIASLIALLKEHGGPEVKEIFVSDGGSTDGTLNISKQAGAKAILSPTKGRAGQMNAAAALASGEILYFVHADTFPPKDFAKQIINAVNQGADLGRFRTKFRSGKWLLKLNAWFTRFDLFVCMGGDQTLFVTKEVFEKMGGFKPDMRIMEEYDFCERARQGHAYKIIAADASVSARKYDTNSWLKVQRANAKVVTLYRRGASQETLLATYRNMLDYRQNAFDKQTKKTDTPTKHSLEKPLITGIQQVGIGVENADKAAAQFARWLGFGALVFEDEAEATLMQQYTGHEVHRRKAFLTLNMNGGGGLEIWQFLSRQPSPYGAPPAWGDLGICALKIKCRNAEKTHAQLAGIPQLKLGALAAEPGLGQRFSLQDPSGNLFQLVESSSFFQQRNELIGGVAGVVIGVSNMAQSLAFYQWLLAPCTVANDGEKTVAGRRLRSVILQTEGLRPGPFARLLGPVEIELVQWLDGQAKHLFADRFWGDAGFIHLCFDVPNMDRLKQAGQERGYAFTVDSENSFAMEAAAGRFAYLEDPDGTLIELVETHKVPIMKKWGWYLHLRKRKHPEQPLPDWMVKLLGLSKVKR